MPKVSVILTSYNHAAYIAATIESVLNQTFADFELLIVDDGSTDNSREIIKTFADERIKTFLYTVNRGTVIAIAEAVKTAQGEYIAVHHSDDLWTSDKLEKQVSFLDANKNYAACFTWVEFIDAQGNSQELDAKDAYKNIFNQPNRSRAEWLNYFFFNANCLCHPSAMLRREVVQKFQLYETHGFWQLPDYLMWIRLCSREEIFILPERLTKFRLRRTRQENTSATTHDKLIRADLEKFFIAKEFAECFTDDKFFLEVFPDAEKFLIDGQINRRFAFAKICLAQKNSAWQLAGLELLKNLLSTPADAAQIKNLYDYDEKTFLHDGGSFDVFNLEQKLSMLHAEIFIGDEQEFIKVAEKIISVDTSGKFYARFDFDIDSPIKFLRFDPDTNFISVKINRTLINGAEYDNFSDNAGEVVDDFRRFWTIDPQIIFDVSLTGHVTFEIFGEREENYSAILDQTLKNFQEQSQENLSSEAPKHDWLQNFQRRLKTEGKEKFLSATRLLYKALPLDDEKKSALKDKFYTSFAPLLKDTQRYKIWQMSRMWQVEMPSEQLDFIYTEIFDGELFEQPGKIAIQAHIFYIDLLDDMATYCANMPYKFDALISVVDETAADKVHAAFEKIPNAEKVIVRTVPNRGRDVAPFLVGFGDILPEYDFAAHIHSKKSLYKGSDQQSWRNYLFDALLGTPEHIRKIFKTFADDETVGVIYPRPAANIPYPSFTWLSNREIGLKLLTRAGIAPNKTDYFDFPAGTMFWARTRALRKFFTLGLTIEDFPPEQGQLDGTIAHAFERSILLAAKSEGMSYCEFDGDAYSVNCGNKNFWQYLCSRNYTADELDWLLNQGEIVTFAVFDTLIMRTVAEPHHVREIIRLKVEDFLGRDFDFPTFRVEAEELARREKNSAVTLDDIYKNFSELTKLDAATCKKIRELELDTELELILPREEVVARFKEIIRRGHEVWLISDTHLQTVELARLLKKCGVVGYKKILLSCETGRRKDTGELWNHLARQGLSGKIIHIGDSESADAQLPGNLNFGIYHLMSALNLFSQTTFGRVLLEKIGGNISLYAGICLGVVLAKKFQSPFRLRAELTDGTNRLTLKTFREVGYWLCGVPLLSHENLRDVSGRVFETYDFKELRKGAEEFCRDVKKIFGKIIERVPIDKTFVNAWIAAFMSDEKIFKH